MALVVGSCASRVWPPNAGKGVGREVRDLPVGSGTARGGGNRRSLRSGGLRRPGHCCTNHHNGGEPNAERVGMEQHGRDDNPNSYGQCRRQRGRQDRVQL